MADSKVVKLLKIVQHETGKDILSSLDEKRLSLLEGYYNSLSEDEQDKIDEKIINGEDNDFAEVAEGMAFGMINGEVAFSKPKTATATAEPPQSSSALAVVPKKPEDLVEEDIDSQILSILGLEEVFDLTYEEYASLLKEKAVEGRMADSQMTTESIELVTNELKRVKGKTGSFKVKPKKVDINKVLDRKQPTPSGAIVKAQKLIPQAAESLQETEAKPAVDTENLQEDLIDGIGNILESLITIRTLMQNQSKDEQKAAQEDRKKTEKEKKKEREKTLEKKKPKSPILKALTKPVGDFFSAIKKFFTNVILGSVVLGIFKWLKDPKNQKAIDDFTNFLEKNAGLILGGLLAVAAVPLVSTILGFLAPITAIAIPAIKAAFAFLASPAGLAALAALAAGTTIWGLTQASKSFEEQAGAMSDEELNKQTKRLESIVSKQDEQGYQRQGESSKDRNYLKALKEEQAKRERVRRKGEFGKENIDKALKRFEEIKTSGSGESIKIPGVGTMQAGRSFLGTPQVKYFNESGEQILKGDFDKILNETISTQNPPAVQPATPKTTDYVSPFAGARDREALKASKITGNAPITIGEKAGYSASRGRVHAGRDIAAPSGTGLQVPSDSVITDKGVDSGYGNYVVFKDSNGIEHLYGHMIEPSPYSKGENVSAGTVIGRVGSTGRSTGPHLHWEVSRVMGEVGRPRQNVIDPIEMGFPAQAPFTGKVEAAQISQSKPSTPSIPSPTGRGNIVPLPIPTGGGAQQASSGTAPNQAPVPRFSSEDPNNTTTMVVRAIYNIVG